MLFQVQTTITIPIGFDEAKLAEISAGERERAKELQLQGKLLHLWRVAGRKSSVLIFKADGPAELHELVTSLPFYPFMNVEVAALCHHPNALETADTA